jgi:hypothetical protein
MADRVSHGEHGEAERQRHADETDAELRKGRGEHRAAASAENQPERAEKFGDSTLYDGHDRLPLRVPSAEDAEVWTLVTAA